MGRRKDDVRVYVISVLFFACSSCGGILLCLYIFFPHSHAATATSSSWLSIVGLTLVAIPWIVWFLIYLYRCLRPGMTVNNNVAQLPFKSTEAAACSSADGGSQGSQFFSPATNHNDGERHVRFGEVVVMDRSRSESKSRSESGDSGGGGGGNIEALANFHDEVSDESLVNKESSKEATEIGIPLSSTTCPS